MTAFRPGYGPPVPGRVRRSTITGSTPTTTTVTPLGEAAEDAQRVPVVSLVVDWDRTGTHPLADITPVVTEVSIDRAATGDLPEQVGLVEGAVAAELTATLAGEFPDYTTAFSQLAPYRQDSALFRVPVLGAPVVCDMGLATVSGPQLERQFTGHIRSLRVNSADRTVTLTALDPADLLRAPITLPAHAQHIGEVIASNHKLNMAPQAVIDYVLRKNGIYASPAPHENAQVSCTGHGWLAAEIGRSAVPRGVAAVIDEDDYWVDGPFNMLAVRGVWTTPTLYQEFFAANPYTPTAGNGIGIGVWVNFGNNMGVTPSTARTMVQVMPLVDHNAWKFELHLHSDGGMTGVVDIGGVDTGFTQPVGTSTQWMYLGLHFQHNTNGTTTIRYRQNGVTTFGNITTPGLTATVAPFAQATVWTPRDWSNLQIWYSFAPPSGAWPGETHTPQASLDAGLNRLTHLPDVVGQDSWDLLKEIAAAEYGRIGFNAAGECEFRSRDTATDPTTVEEEITADRSLMDLATEMTTDSVRNIVTTETTKAYLRFGTVIVESRDALEWQSPTGVWTYDVPLPWGAIGLTSITINRVDSANWDDTVTSGFVSVQAGSPTTEITSGITVSLSMQADRLAVLTVRNYSQFPVRFATTSGSPALRVAGWGLVEEPAELDEVRADGSVELYGPRALPISVSPWRQLTTPLRTIAGGLVSTLSNPTPSLPDVGAVGHPQRTIGHTVRLVDPTGHGAMRANIVAVRRGLSDNGLADSLGLRPVAPPGLGIADDPELGLADSTMVAAP